MEAYIKTASDRDNVIANLSFEGEKHNSNYSIGKFSGNPLIKAEEHSLVKVFFTEIKKGNQII